MFLHGRCRDYWLREEKEEEGDGDGGEGRGKNSGRKNGLW